jgi:hypothetical protein
MKPKMFLWLPLLPSVVPGALAAGDEDDTKAHGRRGSVLFTAVDDPAVTNSPKSDSKGAITVTHRFKTTCAPADSFRIAYHLRAKAVKTAWVACLDASLEHYLRGREPVMRISTSLLALCCQSGLLATLDTPISARSRSNGSRSLRMSPLLMARFTSESIAPWI